MSRAYLPSQPAAGERAERLELETVLCAERQHLPLGVAREQRVLVLHDRDRRKLDRFGEVRDVDIGDADRPDEPLAHEIREGAETLGHRRRRVGLVDQIEVDALDAEVLETLPHDASDPGRCKPCVVIRVHRMEDLARQRETLGPPGAQPRADRRLAAPAAVRRRGVEPAHAALPRGVHQLERLGLAFAPADERQIGADAAEVAAAENDPVHGAQKITLRYESTCRIPIAS